MLANNTGVRVGYLSGRFPGRIGHLFSPGGQRGPLEFIPYCLDNGAYGAGENWSEEKWKQLLNWSQLSGQKPGWVLVPDIVGNRIGTLERWNTYSGIAAEYGWPLAFAVQDGMTVKDVPRGAQVVFVGGTTAWKLRTALMWCMSFPVGSYRTGELLQAPVVLS